MKDVAEQQSLDAFAASLREEPFDTAIILGSGLGALADRVEQVRIISYADIPGFPSVDVAGHGGRLVLGILDGQRVAVFQGRFHFYEGYTAGEAAIPVSLAHALGCHRVLLTCAAGGVRSDFRAGDFMLVKDHINLMGDNPLRGRTRGSFIDLSELYACSFWKELYQCAQEEEIRLHRGVLTALSGPSYETPAEIRMIERLGGDAVSMSTVPEAIMARYLGLDVAGLAFISNRAAGLSDEELTHQDVLARAQKGSNDFCTLAFRMLDLWEPASE